MAGAPPIEPPRGQAVSGRRRACSHAGRAV